MDLKKVREFIEERHYPITALANDLNMSKQSLYMKLSGERDFRASELFEMTKVLRMTGDEILSLFYGF